MVVRQRDGHDRSDDNLTVDDDGTVGNVVHAKHSRLRKVDDGRAEEGTKDTAVRADRERGKECSDEGLGQGPGR